MSTEENFSPINELATIFKNLDGAAGSLERISNLLGGIEVSPLLGLFNQAASPDGALNNFESWLHKLPNPTVYGPLVEQSPRAFLPLIVLLGGSQPLSDALLQNPELATLLFEGEGLESQISASDIEEEGRSLLAAADSRSYSLDRIRYLRRKAMLTLTAQDLCDLVPQEQIWHGLSELAEALIRLTAEIVWKEYGEGPCPVSIVAFGKLGGSELNYSSDVDLVYLVGEGQVEALGKSGPKFCEALGRALGDPMGRGNLYRVDLRLRPFGSAGALLNSLDTLENYYRLYAEPWEVQALLRSRVIMGPPELREGWDKLIDQYCYKAGLTEFALSQMAEMRARLEEKGGADDLKRGPGGIRDIEFLTQILQLTYGYHKPELRVRPTCEALRILGKLGILEPWNAQKLIQAYTFLRRLEHRLQVFADAQTHTLPVDTDARLAVARSMGFTSYWALKHELETHRTTAQTAYRSVLRQEIEEGDARQRVMKRVGAQAANVANWIESLSEPERLYQALDENESSLERVQSIVTWAPLLLPTVKSTSLTEQILSGEIEEDHDEVRSLSSLGGDLSVAVLGAKYLEYWSSLLARWSLGGQFSISHRLSDLSDELIRHLCRSLDANFSLLALGSYGRRELTPDSDFDAIILVATQEEHEKAERKTQKLLTQIAELRQQGLRISLDLRLRPDGGKGLLARSYSGLAAYDLEGMEAWERFALGSARLVWGDSEAASLVDRVSYADPLTPARLKELLAMKRRIETERLDARYRHRNIKLGHGGLTDIEWLIRLSELRYPGARKTQAAYDLTERARRLQASKVLNAVETDELVGAIRHLLNVRTRLQLVGIHNDNIPENPDRLDYLAACEGDVDGNQWLQHHTERTSSVRSLYEDVIKRLGQD